MHIETLKKIEEKEEKEGKFKIVKDIIDTRTDDEKGAEVLNDGYEVNCGTKGSKLSGG